MSNMSLHFIDIYGHLLRWVMASPEQINARTGHGVKVGRGGTSFRIDLSDGLLPITGTRKLFPKSAAAEVAWYLQGSQDVSWIRKHAPLWDKFVEADGKTIQAAYGHRWRAHFGRDQLLLAVRALAADQTDRRVFISAWDPAVDGLGAPNQKNVPCPTSFTFSVLDGELHSSLFLRSSDIFVGLPYDVMGHALLIDAVANTLGLTPGVAQFTLAHAHLYQDHWEMAQTCIDGPVIATEILLPSWSLQQIELNPDSYVEDMHISAGNAPWSAFNPRPFVVE